MVKPIAKAEINTFVAGLITEASPLNFPPNASRDEENFVLKKNGSRERRLGLDVELDCVTRDTGFTEVNLKEVAFSSFKWFGAGNNPNNEFAVLQFGSRIDVYDTSKKSISKDGFIGSVTLTVSDLTREFSYASVDGILVIAANTETIHIVEYKNSALVYTTSRLLVRDLWGLADTENNNVNLRPTSASNAQLYNLRNQGWGIPRKNSAGTLQDPLSIFYSAYTKFPANSEVVYAGLQFQPVTSGTSFERIYPNLYDEVLGLNTSVAAKGYFIIDALKRGTSRFTEYGNNRTKFSTLAYPITSLPTDTTSGGCAVVTDFSGRVFYGGFTGTVSDGDNNSPLLSSYVLFSQVVKKPTDIVKCYQEGDPTSRDNSDIVSTDGGFIRISGAKKIVGLVGLGDSLFIIADNGVWKVSGGSDFGFSADNYLANKLSGFGCTNNKSIVVVNNQIFFWGDEGIFSIQMNQYGDWTVSNISNGSIQTFFDVIEESDKLKAKGVYDSFDKKIRWLFNQDLDRNNLNVVKELALDLQLNAFSVNRFYNLSDDTPEVIGYIVTSAFVSGSQEEDVIVGINDVEVGGEQVVINRDTRASGIQSVKYVTLTGAVSTNIGYCFSEYRNLNFRDWESIDDVGVDAYAYVITGHTTAGDSSVAKQSPYITTHMSRTEIDVETDSGELVPSRTSSCLMTGIWDWADTSASKKMGSSQQIYRYRRPLFIVDEDSSYDSGFEVISSKSKIRGRGKALSLKFETEPYKDCKLLGWNLSLTGNQY
jgi:hypothetical protein